MLYAKNFYNAGLPAVCHSLWPRLVRAMKVISPSQRLPPPWIVSYAEVALITRMYVPSTIVWATYWPGLYNWPGNRVVSSITAAISLLKARMAPWIIMPVCRLIAISPLLAACGGTSYKKHCQKWHE